MLEADDCQTTDEALAPQRRGVRQMDVDRAADALLTSGQRPTIEKIRATTGGSPNTINPMLDEWWRRLSARISVGPSAFERLPNSLALTAEAFFLQALDEARQRAKIEETRGRDDLNSRQQEIEVRNAVLLMREQEYQSAINSRNERIKALELELHGTLRAMRTLQAINDANSARLLSLLDGDARSHKRKTPLRAQHKSAIRKKTKTTARAQVRSKARARNRPIGIKKAATRRPAFGRKRSRRAK